MLKTFTQQTVVNGMATSPMVKALAARNVPIQGAGLDGVYFVAGSTSQAPASGSNRPILPASALTSGNGTTASTAIKSATWIWAITGANLLRSHASMHNDTPV